MQNFAFLTRDGARVRFGIMLTLLGWGFTSIGVLVSFLLSDVVSMVISVESSCFGLLLIVKLWL